MDNQTRSHQGPESAAVRLQSAVIAVLAQVGDQSQLPLCNVYLVQSSDFIPSGPLRNQPEQAIADQGELRYGCTYRQINGPIHRPASIVEVDLRNAARCPGVHSQNMTPRHWI